jgi:hypothetical protein
MVYNHSRNVLYAYLKFQIFLMVCVNTICICYEQWGFLTIDSIMEFYQPG